HSLRKEKKPYAWVAMQTYSGREDIQVVTDVLMEIVEQLQKYNFWWFFDIFRLNNRFNQVICLLFSGSHAPAWEPILDAPASCGLRDAGASPMRSHASAWERENEKNFTLPF
ncbi:hypothetical protein QUF54_04205, partial [Candidatus Marithioploca araucensis]|nr:hypothetical protein [Candidatus Marithioploca araucensis]